MLPQDQSAAAGETPLNGIGQVPEGGRVGGAAEGL
jgi:hypothetical protein